MNKQQELENSLRDMRTSIDKLTTWDFVTIYYPNYDSCSEITYNDDLCKLEEGFYDEGDYAYRLLNEEYGGELNDTSRALIKRDLDASYREIYERAIENYLETLNQ
jgi:hypothetical protein